ncbi:MAG: inositol monophosphatase [Chloroflexi bacterium]|nr:inositol monophosphatase [Chloroflexota bacterium]
MTAAEAAGRELLRRWEMPISGRSSKSSTTDEVSDADRAAETIVVAALRGAYPDDAIVSEEGGGARGTSGRRWLVDPLDGTINYLYRIPQWAVSIARVDSGGPLIGVVHAPAAGETFYAVRGEGAWLRDARGVARRLAVTGLNDLSRALVADGFSYSADERREQARREVGILPRIRDVRRLGSAALDLAFVASGRLDAYAEAGGNEWDWAAGRLLVTEAGGRLSEAPGVRAGLSTLIASGPGIHQALLDLMLHASET